MKTFRLLGLLLSTLFTAAASATPPAALYIFPAGGRQGTTVPIKVGGLDLHQRCHFEMLGPGIEASRELKRTDTVWFEGPLLPLPESQQVENYPKDMAGQVKIAAEVVPGIRHAHVWTSQGACPALKFMVGVLPEVIEQEIEGDPVPRNVTLPVTINGRIFPRTDTDVWAFPVKRGQTITCEVHAARLGSPLDSLIQVLDPHGRVIGENDDTFGADSFLRFTASQDGTYQVRIRDAALRGGQAFVYRLTLSAEPRVDRVFPLGGRRGQTTRFELSGHGLTQKNVDVAIPADAPADFAPRLGNLTATPLIETDTLPEIVETEPNDDPLKATPAAVPAVLNGRIGQAGDRDVWKLSLHKGDKLFFDLRARRLGSPLCGVLTLSDSAGKELARAESAGAQLDPQLRFTVPADGTYFVAVAERFRERGGPDFAYRLRIDGAETPGFRLLMQSDALTLERGKQAVLKVQVERQGGCNGPIALSCVGLPPDVTLSNPTIPANQTSANLTLKASATAPIRSGRITITGSTKVGDQTLTARAVRLMPRGEPALDTLLLAVALPTPFKIVGEHDFRWAARGTVHQRHYQIERGGYEGPIEVVLADRQARHLQGVTAGKIVVPPGANGFDFSVALPPWMEMGRTCRVVVSASAVIKEPDGSELTVSFSSLQPNEQVVVVIGPERLSLTVAKTSLVAVAGKSLVLPVTLKRGKGLTGAVKLELRKPAHMKWLDVDPVTVPAERDAAELSIRFGPRIGLYNAPVVIRATILDNGKPVITEVKLDIEPGEQGAATP